MEPTLIRSKAIGKPVVRKFGATSLDRHGLLAYTAVAYGITWILVLGAYLAVHAGILDPDDGLVRIAAEIAPFGPLIAALAVITLSLGRRGLGALGRSIVRWRVHPLWYVYVFVVIPAIAIAGVAAVKGPDGVGVLADRWPEFIGRLPLIIIATALLTGLAEEPGWRGYAQPWANRRFQPLLAALLVSTIWALWHLPNALFASSGLETMVHIAATIVNGLMFAWILNATGGSVLLVMLAHGSSNAMASLFSGPLSATAAGTTPIEYYVISMVTFGIVVGVVAIATRGRMGLPKAEVS